MRSFSGTETAITHICASEWRSVNQHLRTQAGQVHGVVENMNFCKKKKKNNNNNNNNKKKHELKIAKFRTRNQYVKAFLGIYYTMAMMRE